MEKKLLAIIMIVIVASLSVAGCTTTNTNQTATQHDAFLENYLATFKNVTYSNSNVIIKAWELDWITAPARVQLTGLNKSVNATWAWDQTSLYSQRLRTRQITLTP